MDRDGINQSGQGSNNDRSEGREEVYERIPWETLERPPRDNNRLVLAVAGAVVVGALSFSLVRNQPAAPPATVTAPVTTPATTPVTVAAPVLRSEADLYAVEHEHLSAHAVAHAEWLVVEYVSYDGSGAARDTLESLLPIGVPLPQAPEGTQVYVDWARSTSVTEVGNFGFEVEVLVRSMVAAPGEGFVRQAPFLLVVDVFIGPDGIPRAARPPRSANLPTPTSLTIALGGLPESLHEEVESVYGTVVGGEQLTDGRWRVVVMVRDQDGVTRPRTVIVP